VRGALRILESQGLVELVANSGAWVARFSLAECEEMYQMRERIEPLLLRYSIPGLSPETMEKIAGLTEAMEGAQDADAFLQLDREFHFLTYSGASTAVLGGTVERLWNTTQVYRRAFTFLMDASSIAVSHADRPRGQNQAQFELDGPAHSPSGRPAAHWVSSRASIISTSMALASVW
jgi:DNA-binding GntR family transcriptional regulator